jgi:hypothetical protein
MPKRKPRSKRAYQRALKNLKVSKGVKSILAEIANEVEGAYLDAVNELRSTALETLYLVRDEYDLRDETRDKVKRLIKKLKDENDEEDAA